MTSETLIRASVLGNLHSLLASYGLAPEKVALLSGMTPADPGDETALISQRSYMDLLHLCALETGDPLFALKLGLRMVAGDLGVLGLLAANKPTLRTAIESLNEHFRSYQQGADIAVEPVGDGLVRLTYRVGERLTGGLEADIDLTLGAALAFFRRFFGARWRPREVHVVYGPVAHRKSLERVLDAPVWFLQDANGFTFEERLLDESQPGAEPQRATALEAYLRQIHAASALEADLVSSLRIFIVSNLAIANVSAAAAAADCGMSLRSMQRRLGSRRLTYERLVDETRRDIAERLLATSPLSIAEIAYHCGYGDPANFHRAFLRWAGETPAAYRRARLATN
ncbi:MAG: AraC family transcriptional regulator [Parvibaculum sedimenti]|uniref:AraC family transcriptional regulator n=1 Tax=Parvibaculum sedimenti TaxID=2608632 RepID=UPI003BB63A44